MTDVEFRRRPPLTDGALDELFTSAGGEGSPLGYQQILARSLSWIGAFVDDRLIGYANLAWDGGVHAFLLDPTVHPDFQRRGIGTRLVREALLAAYDHGGLDWVHVDSSDELMNDFYFPVGFTSTAAGVVWVPEIGEKRKQWSELDASG